MKFYEESFIFGGNYAIFIQSLLPAVDSFRRCAVLIRAEKPALPLPVFPCRGHDAGIPQIFGVVYISD